MQPTDLSDTLLTNTFYTELNALVRDTRSLRLRYEALYRLFVELLDRATAHSSLIFSGPFARMQYLCNKTGCSAAAHNRLNRFRCRGRYLSERTDEELQQHFLSDVRVTAEFASSICGVPIPPLLAARLPLVFPPEETDRHSGSYLRVSVTHIEPATGIVTVCPAEGESTLLRLVLRPDFTGPDRSYLLPLLSVGSQLNLVHPTEEEGVLHPELMVLEPDYLVDISSIASGFETYGTTPLNALLQKIQPARNSSAVLLGNFAGQLLDEALHSIDEPQHSYNDSVRIFFRHNALQLASCPDLTPDFHLQAQAQSNNLRGIIARQFKEDNRIDLDRILLEPSFFCEMLGIQGRMDLLQNDFKVLMEQKSGKWAFKGHAHQEKHYVQMLLYQALLHYNFGMKNSDISSYLLYSKYPDGLIRESPAPDTLFRALRLRNEMVAQEYELAQGDAGKKFFGLTPDALNTARSSGKLWTDYQRPQLEQLLSPMQQASTLERSYFNRMMTFVEKEHLLSKTGCSQREAGGQAALWSLTLPEKLEAGLMYHRLRLLKLHPTDEGNGIGAVTLSIPESDRNDSPNFREGDIVTLYSYDTRHDPDIRRTVALRCTIARLLPDSLTLKLRAPQRSSLLFDIPARHAWAVEHDHMDASFRTLYRGLYSLFSATPGRRALLLGQRPPECDLSKDLTTDYSDGGRNPQFNTLVRRAKRAKDFFLLIGPPGTGKTSFGLMNILRESLTDGTTSVLVTAYTNRAVDEICSKLVKAGLDFVRIGSEPACDPSYKSYLLSERLRTCLRATEVQALLKSTRIVTGTVSSLSSSDGLFRMKHFETAIVDEASQILEPQLMTLLCAGNGKRDAIDKFVLIGDHKQLPAVVMQNEQDSLVKERELREIGLTDCRHSLFERLLNNLKGNELFQFTFQKQGRMHPDVALFANRAFYGGMLSPIPLEHQNRPLWLERSGKEPLQSMLSGQRLVFMDSPLPGTAAPDKVNEPEADRIAAAAAAIVSLYKENGLPFNGKSSLGIIVPYRGQIALIRRKLKKYNLPELSATPIDTVERFQGSECDVIIYGFTVHRLHQLQFLTANTFLEEGRPIDRKLNVALTRAREQLILVGNAALLGHNILFHSLLSHCKGHGAYITKEDFPQNA